MEILFPDRKFSILKGSYWVFGHFLDEPRPMKIDISEDTAEALAHYYDGAPCEDAAQMFFASCADALIQAHARRERVAFPLQLTTDQPAG
jgi:hypothetical protein